MSYRSKFHYPPETDQNIVNDDDDKLAERDMEIVEEEEEAFYRPKSSLIIPSMIDNSDMEALSRALFYSNQMNLFEKTHETMTLLDKETGEKTSVGFNF